MIIISIIKHSWPSVRRLFHALRDGRISLLEITTRFQVVAALIVTWNKHIIFTLRQTSIFNKFYTLHTKNLFELSRSIQITRKSFCIIFSISLVRIRLLGITVSLKGGSLYSPAREK
jgi:hypothetical protein